MECIRTWELIPTNQHMFYQKTWYNHFPTNILGLPMALKWFQCLWLERDVKVHIFLDGHKIFAKSSPYFWVQYIQSRVRERFCKILWPSQNIWTLNSIIESLWATYFCYTQLYNCGNQKMHDHEFLRIIFQKESTHNIEAGE